MTITYRTDGAWGTGKGGNLTPAEVDGNFHDLAQQIAGVAAGLVPAEIQDITLVGSQMTITLSDARTFGPFTIPRATLNWRGDFADATIYAANDIVKVPGEGVYLVLQAHTGVAPFDPARLIGGTAVYAQMIGESTGDVGLSGPIVTTSDGFITPTLEQAGGFWRFTGNNDFTLPPDSDVAFEIGTEFRLRQHGTGTFYVQAGSGVTVNLPPAKSNQSLAQGAVANIKKVGADEWDVWGDLA